MSTSDIPSLVGHLKTLTHSPPPDKLLRKELYDTARELLFSLEDPLASVYRIISSVSIMSLPFLRTSI